MGDLTRLYNIPGFNEPGGRASSLRAQEIKVYSPELRALCRYRMDECRPDVPMICPRCRRKSTFKEFLTYMEGLGAAIGYSCNRSKQQCPDQVHWPSQPDPTIEHLRLIQRQRDLDKDKAEEDAGADRAELAVRQCAIDEDFRKMQQNNALWEHDSEHSLRGQGPDGKRVFRNANNQTSNTTVKRELSPEDTTGRCGGEKTFMLALWTKAGERPDERELRVRGPDTWCLQDHGWILAKQDVPWDLFQVWSVKLNGWIIVPYVAAEQILENSELCLVRLESAEQCVGLGAYIMRVQTPQMHARLGEELVQDLIEQARAAIEARVHVADTIWVVLWSKEHDIPTAARFPINPAGEVNLAKNDSFFDFESTTLIEFWNEGKSTWSHEVRDARVPVPKGTETLLVRVDNAPVMLLLGLELEYIEANRAHNRRERAKNTQHVHSPSLEVLDDATAAAVARGGRKRIRSLSQELVNGRRPGPSTRNSAHRTTQHIRSPSLEVLNAASAAAVVRRRPKRARSLFLELVEAPSPGPSSRSRVRSSSVEIID